MAKFTMKEWITAWKEIILENKGGTIFVCIFLMMVGASVVGTWFDKISFVVVIVAIAMFLLTFNPKKWF